MKLKHEAEWFKTSEILNLMESKKPKEQTEVSDVLKESNADERKTGSESSLPQDAYSSSIKVVEMEPNVLKVSSEAPLF